MKIKIILVLALLVCEVIRAESTLEYAAARILVGGNRAACLADFDGDGNADGTVLGHTMDQVRAITNRADVLALAAQMDAEAAAPRVEPNGIQAPIYYIPDATGSNGVALVAVSAAQAPQALRDCGKAGIPFAVVLAGGFEEIGAAGAEMQRGRS